METNFGMLHHDTYTKYLSRHATSNVTDTLLRGDNIYDLAGREETTSLAKIMSCRV